MSADRIGGPSQQSDSAREGGDPLVRDLILGLFAAVLWASADSVYGLLTAGAPRGEPLLWLAPLGHSLVLFFLIWAGLWVAILPVVSRRCERAPAALATAWFIGSCAVIGNVFNAQPIAIPWRDPLHVLLVIAFCGLNAAFLYGMVRGAAWLQAASARLGPAQSMLVLAMVPTLVWSWWQGYYANGFLSIGGLTGIAALVVVLKVSAQALHSRGWALSARWLVIASATVLLAAIPGPLLYGPSRAKTSAVIGGGDATAPVILITIDTLRADALSCYGGPPKSSPNIDALAAQGDRFTNAVSPAPWTLPSITSIMTGLSVFAHDVDNMSARLPDNLATLAEHMRRTGRTTAAIGLNPFFEDQHNVGQGFDDLSAFYPRPSLGSSFGSRRLQGSKGLWTRIPDSEQLTEDTLAWLESNHEKPFFLWVHYLDPHTPYTPPVENLDETLYSPKVGYSLRDLASMHAQEASRRFDTHDRRWIRELYQGEVRDVDANVGRILDRLRAYGIYDEALIVLTSDHGEEFWEHDGFEHGRSLYRELLQVPLIIKQPNQQARAVVDELVGTVSLTPTLLDWADLDWNPEDYSAASLLPLLEGRPEEFQPAPVFSTSVVTYEDRMSVVFDNHKYIRSKLTGREELYDLAADPQERLDLMALHPEVAAAARKLLGRHIEASAELRGRLGLTVETNGPASRENRKMLESLGYVH